MSSSEEKRKFPRLSLSIEDGYFGNFKLSNQDKLIALIVNLSAGGLNMAVTTTTQAQIKQGDGLLLESIAGGANLAFISGVQAQIRWVKPLKNPGYVFVGCEFKGISDALRSQISSFVSSERMTRGQYD